MGDRSPQLIRNKKLLTLGVNPTLKNTPKANAVL
jgi:hypothetical protein